MNESRDKIRALWSRQLAGEQLEDAECELLRDAFREDPDLMAELSSDATSHALLHSLEDVVQTEDDFVQSVLRQTMGVQNAEGDSPTVAATNSAPTIPTASLPTELPLLVDRHSGCKRPDVRRRGSQQWLALSLTLILFLSAGFFFWFQGNRPSEVVKNDQPPTEQIVVENRKLPQLDDRSRPGENQNIAAADDVKTDGFKTAEEEEPKVPDSSPTQMAANKNDNATTPDNEPNTGSPKAPDETRSPETAHQFATLTKVKDPVWERTDTVGTRFGDEKVRLFGGSIELTFDDGAVVTLNGPVEFQPRTAGRLILHRGPLSASVPRKAIGFTVLTPTSEVVDLGTEFEVSVKDTGASDVIVRKGKIEVAPSGLDRTNFRKWKMIPRGFHQASFYPRPTEGQPGPIAAKLLGANGQFRGIISLDGKTAEFQSASTFDCVHEQVLALLKTSEQNTLREWPKFVDSMRSKMRGTMNFNGRQMQFGNLDEVMRLHNQIKNQTTPNAGSQFTGSINVNGKVIQFKTREEFEAARKAAFGAAANFGAGDFFNRNRSPR